MAANENFTKRLATIVVIDVVGYSSRVELDLSQSLSEVADFGRLVLQTAQSHGGRLFKTTGDGFLLEFPTVSGALEFTDGLRTASTVPIRIGVHIGEVAVTPENDLLGHTVNVAARLEAMASSNEVLVSAEIVRAVQGAFPRRFTRRGQLRLKKMQETLLVYRLETTDKPKSRWRFPHTRSVIGTWPLLASAACLTLAAVAVFFSAGVLRWMGPHRPLVAILEPELLSGTSEARDLANEIARTTLDAATADGLDAISKSTATGGLPSTRLVVGGFLKQRADAVEVTIEIADAADHAMLWSGAFRGEGGGGAKALAAQVAYKTTDMLSCGARAYAAGVALTTDSRRLWFKACDSKRQHTTDVETRDIYEALTKQAPNFSPGFSGLALALAFSTQDDQSRKEAYAAARRALQLDPRDPFAFYALALLAAPTQWAQREAFLLNGLSLAPNASLLTTEGTLLLAVGRIEEAYGYARRALALDSLSPTKRLVVVNILLDQRRSTDAYEMYDEAKQYWPFHPVVREFAFRRALDAGDGSATDQILNDPSRRPAQMSDKALEIWRRFPAALRGTAAEKLSEGAALRDAMFSDDIDEPLAIHGLLMLGQDDILFGELMREGVKVGQFSETLFGPDGDRFRSQKRFMRLAAITGLIDYWQSTKKWPDFCSQPGLPYDCRAEAARAMESPEAILSKSEG